MITALIIFFCFCVVMIIIKGRQHKHTQKPKDTHKVINLTLDCSKPIQPPEYYEKRRKRLKARGARLDRQRRIWSVLYLVNSFYNLEELMKQGDYIKRAAQDLERAKGFVLEYKPTESDIKTAIRFCQIEHARGKCPHKLTPSDIETITNIYTVAQLPPPIALN